MKKATVSAPIMNENRNFHHFLNMSRNIHDVISATKVKGTEITKNIGHIESKYAEINIDAAKSTGKSHQNLLMKFFILLCSCFCCKTFLLLYYCRGSRNFSYLREDF